MKKLLFIGLFTILSMGKSYAQEPFIGEIRMFAGNFEPKGWAFCDGRLLQIQQNSTLYAILGTTYGGDGVLTFALPDLKGRVPVGIGQGPGLSKNYILGEKSGTESVTLSVNNLPSHSHTINAVTAEGNQNSPVGNLPADTKTLDKEYSNANANTTMKSTMVNPTGGNLPFSNMQPSLGINYIIALEGIFPLRN